MTAQDGLDAILKVDLLEEMGFTVKVSPLKSKWHFVSVSENHTELISLLFKGLNMCINLCRTGTGDCIRWSWLLLAKGGTLLHWGCLNAVPMCIPSNGLAVCWNALACAYKKKVDEDSPTSLPRAWMSRSSSTVPWVVTRVVAPTREMETPSLGHSVGLGDALGDQGATHHQARAHWSTRSDAKYLHQSRQSKHLSPWFIEEFFSISWLLPCEAVGTSFPAGFFIFLPVCFIFYKPI